MADDPRSALFAAARQLIPDAAVPKVTVVIKAAGVRMVLEDVPLSTPLSAVEQAIAIFLRDPNQSQRSIARQVGCSASSLSESKVFRRLRQAFAGQKPRRGRRFTDGRIEADDVQENSEQGDG